MPKRATKDQKKVEEYKQEFTKWLNVLEIYHTERFDRNYRQYTAFAQTKGTSAQISDPVTPELVERANQKMFEQDPRFYAQARGQNIPREITNIMSGVASYYWNSPERVAKTGTMRSKLKVLGREFLITGNGGVETFYNTASDSPDTRVWPVEDVIFDPTKTLKTSPKFFTRQFVSLAYLKENRKTSEGGLFDNVDEIENAYDTEQTQPQDPTPNQVNRAGSEVFQKPVDELLLVSRWEGTKLCQIIDWKWIVREVDDPMQIGEDPFDFVMDVEVPKQPYALSFLDYLNGLTQAKDLILNQVLDYGSKALNPPLFVDPSLAPINRQTLRNAWKMGGLVYAAPQQVAHLPMPNLPNIGFDLLTYIQQRSESVSGLGSYVSGVPNQSSDKTQGTKGGIEALIRQAQSPIQDRQTNIEESVVEPMINKWLKMAGQLMGKDEVKYVFLSGESPKWVKTTKGLLTGKITLRDLLVSEMVSIEEAVEIAQMLQEQGKDPAAEFIFDVDWIIRVETGSMAAVDQQQDMQNFERWVAFNLQAGVPMDMMKVSKEMGNRAKVKEPEMYLQQPGMAPTAPSIGTPGLGVPGQQSGQQPGQPGQQMQPMQQMQRPGPPG